MTYKRNDVDVNKKANTVFSPIEVIQYQVTKIKMIS